MANNPLSFLIAAALGGILQFLVRLSNRTGSKQKKLAVNLAEFADLLVIHVFLLFLFGDGTAQGSSIAAACITFAIGAAVLLMQFFFDRKHGLTDEQKMYLNEI